MKGTGELFGITGLLCFSGMFLLPAETYTHYIDMLGFIGTTFLTVALTINGYAMQRGRWAARQLTKHYEYVEAWYPAYLRQCALQQIDAEEVLPPMTATLCVGEYDYLVNARPFCWDITKLAQNQKVFRFIYFGEGKYGIENGMK